MSKLLKKDGWGWGGLIHLTTVIFLLPTADAGLACLSDPCIHGVCIDDVNSTYSCFCIDGYTGFHCQTDWNECWSNPCQNGGNCNDGIAEYNCSCASGFQGERCEENVNECQSNPCHNNGTCLDAADGYTCYCLPGFSGTFCELDISVCNATGESRCENGGLCVEGLGSSFSCICPQGWVGIMCEEAFDECASSPCENGAMCIDYHANYSCACSFGYTGRNCEIVLEMCGENDNCENGALCLIENWQSICYCVPDFHGDRCQFQYDECQLGPGCANGGTCIDGVDMFTCSCPPDLTGDRCECLIISENEQNCSYVAPTMMTDAFSTSPITTLSTTLVPTTTEYATTTEPTLPISPISVSTTTDYLSTDSSTNSESTIDANQPETQSSSTADEFSSESTTQSTDLTSPLTFEMNTTIFPDYFTTLLSFTGAITETEIVFPTKTTATTVDVANCRKTPCLNGGMCLQTPTGLRCVCKAGWEGVACDERQSIKVAAFSGQSFVSHKPGNSSHTQIDVTVRTIGVAGLIFYEKLAQGAYLALYLEEGLLKFKFSCGMQTMLLSEVQFHINNGYDLVVTVTLEFLPVMRNVKHCLATVRVNNTLAMSGEQIAMHSNLDPGTSWLYLGGIPANHTADMPQMDGFVGCMHNLLIDGQLLGIFKDAVESYDIRECVSLACLSGPCHNAGTCIERDTSWICNCPSGFLGEQCERSVCDNNPCEFGGTCVAFPSSGFICLCPFGKHGQFCEHDLDIGHSVFASSIAGYSSYSAHPLPTDIHDNLVLNFKFIPHDMEQISLMVFVGQDGSHGPGSDHLAVSFIKGYIVLTWNLGSGPRRIFTKTPIMDSGHRPHAVQVGRNGQKAWLFVDNLGNVTGQSPGSLTKLNTRPVLYLGGHESGNFSLLPHDLPLHTGFSGCLFDVRLQTGQMMIMVQQTRTTTGRSVGQCGTSLCHEHACQNGGGCINHGATFTCLCADGWFGPSCGLKFNPCDSTQHNCSNGATCVPQRDGYVCDCPLGKTGTFCDDDEDLSDIKFSGSRSYVAIEAEGLQQHRSCIDLEVMPTKNQGLLLYMGRSDTKSFVTLSLHGGVLELRIYPGRQRGIEAPMVIRSRRLLALEKWHRVRAARYGRRVFLWVEGTVNSAVLSSSHAFPATSPLLYIGGVPDLSALPFGVMASHVSSFQGCVRRLSNQWKPIRLNVARILHAKNVADCDGTLCGGDVCSNGGSCQLVSNAPVCECTKEFWGRNCEKQTSCEELGCKNGGKCVQEKSQTRCSCPIGTSGPFCETDTSSAIPSFGTDSYLVIERASGNENALIKHAVDFVYVNFTTTSSDGMLLWTSRANAQEYLGIGVEDHLLKIVWAWETEEPTVITVRGTPVSDGIWHDLAVSLVANNISIWFDHHSVPGPAIESARPLVTDGRFYLAGFSSDQSIHEATYGHFSNGFHGCVQKIAWDVQKVISNFAGFEGDNVGVCDPFHKF